MELEFVDLKQRQLEAFDVAYNEYVNDRLGRNVSNGGVVYAAITAGWLVDPPDDDVGEMLPSEVVAMARQINELYVSVTRIDPN